MVLEMQFVCAKRIEGKGSAQLDPWVIVLVHQLVTCKLLASAGMLACSPDWS
jgi:hypothetical protein